MGLRAVEDVHRIDRCADRAAPRPNLGYSLDLSEAKIELPQINERVKTLAAAQSVDIAERLRSEGIDLIAGRGS